MRTICPASGTSSPTWPGREDVCPLCLTTVTVRRDGTLRLHRLSRRKAAAAARRYANMRARARLAIHEAALRASETR